MKSGSDQLRQFTSFAQQQSRASAFILSIDDEEIVEEKPEAIEQLRKFVTEIRYRNEEIPIFLHGETALLATFQMRYCASCTVLFT